MDPASLTNWNSSKIAYRRQASLTLRYETVVIPRAYEIDFVIDGYIVIELKALEKLAPVHARQLQTPLRLCPSARLREKAGASRRPRPASYVASARRQ